jgi:hypothetical protein
MRPTDLDDVRVRLGLGGERIPELADAGDEILDDRAAAMCIAVGNVSFEDCDRLMWSFGWTGRFDPISPPAISIARFEMTSFAFMFDCVPDPVCHTKSGKWSSSVPSMTSSAAATISRPSSGSSRPFSTFASAAAFLRTPIARTISTGMRSATGHPIEK